MGLTEKIFTQPQLLQKREIWKRIGIFFENLRRYECMPDDPELVPRAQEMAKKLRSLKSVFASDLKGVSTAEAVAGEAENWAQFISPLLSKQADEGIKFLEESKKNAEGKGDKDGAQDGKKKKKMTKKEKKE